MQKFILSILIVISTLSFAQEKSEIDLVIKNWHKAAADANFREYFHFMTKDAVFIGTDPTENWAYPDFKTFAKPYFDNGKAWSFFGLERNIFVAEDADIAWFDELLDTQMGICRGSGVLQKTNEGWKIKHYVLSIAIPNENVKEITAIKEKFDDDLMKKLRAVKN